MHSATPLKYACVLSALFLIGYGVVGSSGWLPYDESTRLLGQVTGWCERAHPGLFREPVNALSNLTFMVCGLGMFYVIGRDDRSDRNPFVGIGAISVLYAATVVWLGGGSMLMHGTHTVWGGWADNLSMVMYIVIPWLFNVATMARWTAARFMLVYVVIVSSYALARAMFGGRLGIGLDLFSLSIALWGISEFLYAFWSPRLRWLSGFAGFVVAAAFGITPMDMAQDLGAYWWVVLFWLPAVFCRQAPDSARTYTPWYWLGVASYLIAFVVWTKGKPGELWCQPDSLLQWHGVWHALSAVATVAFFVFLRSQRDKRLFRVSI